MTRLGERVRRKQPPDEAAFCVWCGELMYVHQRAYLRMASLWGRVLCAPLCSGRCEESAERSPYTTEVVVRYRMAGREDLSVLEFRGLE